VGGTGIVLTGTGRGARDGFLRKVKGEWKQMRKGAEELEFEKAAMLRDRIF